MDIVVVMLIADLLMAPGRSVTWRDGDTWKNFNKFKHYILLGGGGTLILGGTLIAGFMESAGGCGRLRRPGQLPNSVSCCLMGGRTGEGNRFTLHFSNSYISLRIL